PRLETRGGNGGAAVALPTARLDVEAVVEGDLARVTITQEFVNVSDRPIDATYLFPLQEEAAVTALELRMAGEVVKAHVERREAPPRAIATSSCGGRSPEPSRSRPRSRATAAARRGSACSSSRRPSRPRPR